jgi:uncharacterized protein (TIGR03083 family)
VALEPAPVTGLAGPGAGGPAGWLFVGEELVEQLAGALGGAEAVGAVPAGDFLLGEVAEGNGGVVDGLVVAGGEQIIGTVGQQELPSLADRVEAAADDLLAAAERLQPDQEVSWHAGLRMPLSTVLAVACGECLVHGRDIARAAGRPWPVPADWARTVFLGLLPVVPHYLRAERAQGRPARYDIRLRGEHAARAVFTIEDGVLTVGTPAAGQRADCYLSADPWALLLVLYGRSGPLKPALSGRILAWGHRPWLAFTLPTLFRKP